MMCMESRCDLSEVRSIKGGLGVIVVLSYISAEEYALEQSGVREL